MDKLNDDDLKARCLACGKTLPDIKERNIQHEEHNHQILVRPKTARIERFDLVLPDGVETDSQLAMALRLRMERLAQRMHLECFLSLLELIESHLGLPSIF